MQDTVIIGPWEAVGSSFSLWGMGDYSLAKHFALLFLCVIIFTSLAFAITRARGQSIALGAHCALDVLKAFGCAISVILFSGFFYFLGRAFWNAATAEG